MFKYLILVIACFVGSLVSAQTFSSTVNQPIPDDGTSVSFPIVVSGLLGSIDTVFGLEQICFNITHPYVEDITLRLVAPNGKVVRVLGGIGGGGDDFTNTCLVGSGTPLSLASPPYSGTFQSIGILGDFNKGQNPNGTWTLVVEDTYAFADAGFFIDWSLSFGNDPAYPFYFTSSDLPIVKLTTVATPIGDDPKVPVTMQIIDNGPGQRNYVNQTNYAFSGNIMAELQGFSGVGLPKKNYDFEVVDAQGNDLETTLLGLPAESDWIFKSEYLDHTLIKNSLTYEMARRMGLYAPRTKPCEIILDGEYIGLYSLTEKVKRSKNRVDIARLRPEDLEGSELTGGYIFEMNINNNHPADWVSPHLPINYASNESSVEFKYVYPRREVIEPEQAVYLQNYVNGFESALLADNFADPVAGFRAFADEQSFINFLIVNEFSVNYDSYGRSTYLVKEKDTDGGKLRCGPPWDFDRAYGEEVLGSGWVWESTHPVWPFPFWWSRLWEDSTYRKRLACRWTMLRQNTLSDTQFMAAIDSLSLNISEGQARNFTAWNDLNIPYKANVDTLRSFLLRRLHWIDSTLAVQQVSPPDFYLPTDTTWIKGQVFDAAQIIGNQYTYNWHPGADTSTIVFPSDGLYQLVVTDKYGCFARKSMQVTLEQSAVFDLDGGNLGGVSVFPNPYSAQLKVDFEQAPRANFTLTLENEMGQRVLSQAYPAGIKQPSITTANLPAGKYVLRCISEEKSWTTKLLKLND
jgi:subtilisin-like proprotein convertase family protein